MTVTVNMGRHTQAERVPYSSLLPTVRSMPAPLWVGLDFNELSEFELVNDHYQAMGIRFSEAIALSPSNPLFSPFPHRLVLAPRAYPNRMTLQFSQSLQAISLLIAMTHQIRYDIERADHHIDTHFTPDLATGHPSSAQCPIYRLELRQPHMTQLTLNSVAPFIVKQILCQFTAPLS